MAERDLLLGEDGDLVIRNGDFAAGDALHDDVGLLLLTCKGEHMLAPFVGCDLPRRMNGTIRRSELLSILRRQCEKDGKNWADVMSGINIATNG